MNLEPDHVAFLQRLAKVMPESDAAVMAARPHVRNVDRGVRLASEAMLMGHPASARAYLESARIELDAAINALPEL